MTIDRFAPGMPDGPPMDLPEPLPAHWGEPLLDPDGQRDPVRYVPAGNQMIPMTASQIADLVRLHQPPAPAPAPARGVDRFAQRLMAGGVCAVGVGYGTSLALNAAAGLSTGAALALAAAVAACKLPAMGKRVTNNVINNVAVNAQVKASWFGHASAPTSTTTNNFNRR